MDLIHRDEVYEIEEEAERARERYGPFTSTHEALGVLTEECDELLDAVRENKLESIRSEAIQVAAVALRLAIQCRGNADADFHERSMK